MKRVAEAVLQEYVRRAVLMFTIGLPQVRQARGGGGGLSRVLQAEGPE